MISREERRAARVPRVAAMFEAATIEPVLDLLETMEIAWHDIYGETSPPEPIIDDVLELSDGELSSLIRWVRLALADRRDLKVAVERKRS